MSTEGLEALRARVHADAELARRLRRVEPERFTDEVLELAAAAGYDVTAAELHETIARAREAWILRWIR
ncbi:MAG: hypothetical protein JWM87_1070 [Candidatus Eremiobacteraeota bacterium]|nr:hypothetical protein [Candidatus Eremiobacteraeota bacterium]